MSDIIEKLYHFVDEELPIIPLEYDAERALSQTLSEEQRALFEEYQTEVFRNGEAERMQLFRSTLSLGRKLSQL